MTIDRQYADATVRTADNLGSIARLPSVRELTRLTLPEIEAVVDLVARMVPAGNVPGVILSGLVRLSERRLPAQTVKRDINLLFKGVEQFLDKAMYGTFFAGPAAVIWGYQNLLKLAGKNPEDAFPEGTWQFYLEYALRDDTARHANETHGFDTVLNQHNLRLSPVDRVTAWVMAAIHCLHQYDALLENEWRERVYTGLLREVTREARDAARYARSYRAWEAQRPYRRGPDAAPGDDYPLYRRIKFDGFMDEALRGLPEALRREWDKRVQVAEEQELPAYQRQLSILAYLDPGAHAETRLPVDLEKAHVGVIAHGRYYLIPACAPDTDQPAEVSVVRAQVASLLNDPTPAATGPLAALAQVKRSALSNLRHKLSHGVLQSLDTLRSVPILLNSDPRPRHSFLSDLRRTERGLGDHALTLFDTGETIVFDQSHIFFDGAWGAALAEIMTNEALSWAVYLNRLPSVRPGAQRVDALSFPFLAADLPPIRQATRVTAEASAETDQVNIKAILALRKLFKQRNDLLQLTVNDLLILYRAIHAVTYQPEPELSAALKDLARDHSARPAAQAALEAIGDTQVNPSVLIPIDASSHTPRDRLYPLSFEVPLKDLDLLALHKQVITALDAYAASTDDLELYAEFDKWQRAYLATLAGFGAVLNKAKDIAVTGESASVGSIKLLAHIPFPLQRLLDAIPGRFDVLNDIIKGREILSNMGAVAPGSTLTRFMTAKDDNEKKTLAWGVLTNTDGVMHITLRDFRPHVGLLEAAGQARLAVRITQSYLDAYAHGLNRFVRDLQRITLTSRETRTASLRER